MSSSDNLDRFLTAQTDTYETALGEIKRGAKRTHWMWYIFPQIAGLGSSSTAKFYAISSLDEARAYLKHPVLSRRLRTCLEALQDLPATSAEAVFGSVDALKLRSSLTLFDAVQGGQIYRAALDRWFAGQADRATVKLLSSR
jgi:uncharacterized protein (DUF1810 family)